MHKYGREFSATVMENRDGIVTDRVARKLMMATPSFELVEAYLTEIAKAYGVSWSPTPLRVTENGDGSHDGSGGLAEKKAGSAESTLGPNTSETPDSSVGGRGTPKLPDIPPIEDEADAKGKATGKISTPLPVYKAPPEDDFDALTRRFEALKKR